MSRLPSGHRAPLRALRSVGDGRAPIGSDRDALIFAPRLEPDPRGNSTVIVVDGNRP